MVPGQRRPLYTGVKPELNAGDVMVVIGGSGRGKSSLLRVQLVSGPAGGGSVTLGGVELASGIRTITVSILGTCHRTYNFFQARSATTSPVSIRPKTTKLSQRHNL